MNNKTILAFGEIMLRLTAKDLITNASEFSACYGGSESNVLVALSRMGNSTRYLTRLPDNDLGRGALMHLKKYDVDCADIIIKGDNMGMYFLETGYAERQSKVIYARKNAEVTNLCEDDFCYDRVLRDCGLLYITGISFALSPSVISLCFRLMEEAKKRGIPIGFDFNYRAKLWSQEAASEVYKKIIPFADLVFCSERDLTAFLGACKENFFNTYKNTKYLVVREREIISRDRHSVKACVYTSDGLVATSEKEFDVLERIGGGDAFAAGFLHGWLNFGEAMPEILNFAITSFAIKHTIPGDVLPLSEKELKAHKTFSSKDVMR